MSTLNDMLNDPRNRPSRNLEGFRSALALMIITATTVIGLFAAKSVATDMYNNILPPRSPSVAAASMR